MHKIAASFSGGSRAKDATNNGSNVDEFGAGHRDRAGNSSMSYPGPVRSNQNDGRPPIPEDPRRRNSRAANTNNSFSPSPSHSPSPSSSSNVRQASTAALHSLPAIAELLNSHKVYRAGYIWRLDNDPSASTKQSGPGHAPPATTEPTAFVKYFMRLEDCILCLWPDEGLKEAQAKGTTIHPTSMNVTEGFVALASSKPEWAQRAQRFNSPTPLNFVLNTAGNNSIIFGCETEEDMRRWMNAIRLAVWERSRVELMYTAARLGIREEQQGQPIRSALYMRHGGAKVGRAEGYFDIRLPGDTEWKRVYGVLTDPDVYDATKSDSITSPKIQQAQPAASTTSGKKDKRKSFLGLLSGSSSKNDIAKETAPPAARTSLENDVSPVSYQHNPQLEDPAVGPTFAIFGILSGGGTSGDPASPNARQSDLSSSISSTSSASGYPLKLTRRPIIIVRDVYSAYAVWPESEGLVPHSKLFKMEGRLFYDDQEIASYSAAPNMASGKGPMSVFMEAMRRENRDLGKVEHQNTLLCMHAGSGREAVGPGNAVKAAYPGDVGSETLSWCLALYDAFRLHGRPERLIYNPTHPFSPYFCQPMGPTRGRLYFETDLTEDLPNIDDNRPREINNQYMRILFERMSRAGAIPPGPIPRPFLSPAMRGSPKMPSQQHDLPPSRSQQQQQQQTGRSVSPRMHIKEESGGEPFLPAIPTISTEHHGRSQSPSSQRHGSSVPQSRERSPLLDAGSFDNNVQTARLSPSLGTSGSPNPRSPSAYSGRYAGSNISSQQPASGAADSFSQEIAQAMLQSEEPQVAPRAMDTGHPGMLPPGGSGRNSRRTSLSDVHRADEPMQRQQEGYAGSYGYNGGNDMHAGAPRSGASPSAADQPLTNDTTLSRQDTTASHYNTTPSRSHTPAQSIASATALNLPGGYVSETPQQTPALEHSSNDRQLESHASPTEVLRNVSPPQIIAERTAPKPRQPEPYQEESVLTDEPGALFALSLPDDEVPRQQPTHRTEAVRSNTQDSLVAAIKQRAGANPAASPVSAGGISNTATRSSTMGTNTPISGMPSSASEYSQSGNTVVDTMLGPRTQSEGISMSRQVSASSEGRQGSSSGHTQQNAMDEQARRLSRVSGGGSTVEGQDDYLAGLNYLALTEGTEEPTPAPTRPLRTTAGSSNNTKPAISISTGNKVGVGGFTDPGANGNGHTSPSSSSPIPESPLSPDPYGTYAEPAKASSKPTKASSTNKRRPSGPSATSAPPPPAAPMPVQTRKAGRRGVPSGRKPARKLGSWSSDEDSSNSDKDEDEDEEDDRNAEHQRSDVDPVVSPADAARERHALLADDESRNRDLRASTSSGGSIRRALPQLPGPSTDPYINQNALSQSQLGRESPYGGEDAQYAQYAQQHSARPSMYGWPGQTPMGMMPHWHMQQQQMSPYSPHGGSPQPFSPPYGQSPSPSPHGNFGPGQETMVSSIQQDPNTAAADGKAARQAAVAPHGLLQAGLQDKHQRSAAQIEAQAKESGGPLLQMGHKAQAPQGGLMGAIATHEREKKREGGLGATLTERERERRLAETRQREMEQMHHRQSSMFGGSPFNWAGMAPAGGFNPAAGPYGMDPAQMQQQMAMLAAQNAYLQAMAGFNNPAMQNPGFMSPFGQQPNPYGGSQIGFSPSYLGVPQSQSPQPQSSRGPSPSGAPYGHHQAQPSYGGQPGEYR